MKMVSLSFIVTLMLIFSKKLRELKTTSANKSSTRYLLLAGFVGWVLGAILVYISFDLGSAVMINLIVGLNPIFAVTISLFLKMERFSRLKFIGMVLCIFSSILLIL